MQSTIAQAKRRLEEAAPGLNPAMYKRLNDEIEEAEQRARQTANQHASRKATKLLDSASGRHAPAV